MADKKLSLIKTYSEITLSKIDVSEHTEKKMNLTYLSWASMRGVYWNGVIIQKLFIAFYEDERPRSFCFHDLYRNMRG